jgi:hypothetical protein
MQSIMTSSSSTTTTSTHWLWKDDDASLQEINALCLGTGRFLRSVLVPSLNGTGRIKTCLIQTRGRSFLEYMQKRSDIGTYEVDTVLESGDIETQDIPCYGAFSLGRQEDKHALVEVLPKFKG